MTLCGVAPPAMSEAPVRDFLAQHPKTMGVLFAALLILWNSGAVAAGTTGCSTTGP